MAGPHADCLPMADDLIGNLCLLIPLWRGQSFLYLVRTEYDASAPALLVWRLTGHVHRGAAMRDEVLHQCWCCPSRETAMRVRHRIAERRRRKRSAQAHTSMPMVVAVHTPSQGTNDSGTDGSGKSAVELTSQRPSSSPAIAPSPGVAAPRPESKQCWNSSTRLGGAGPVDGEGTSASDRPGGVVPPAKPRSLSPGVRYSCGVWRPLLVVLMCGLSWFCFCATEREAEHHDAYSAHEVDGECPKRAALASLAIAAGGNDHLG